MSFEERRHEKVIEIMMREEPSTSVDFISVRFLGLQNETCGLILKSQERNVLLWCLKANGAKNSLPGFFSFRFGCGVSGNALGPSVAEGVSTSLPVFSPLIGQILSFTFSWVQPHRWVIG